MIHCLREADYALCRSPACDLVRNSLGPITADHIQNIDIVFLKIGYNLLCALLYSAFRFLASHITEDTAATVDPALSNIRIEGLHMYRRSTKPKEAIVDAKDAGLTSMKGGVST